MYVVIWLSQVQSTWKCNMSIWLISIITAITKLYAVIMPLFFCKINIVFFTVKINSPKFGPFFFKILGKRHRWGNNIIINGKLMYQQQIILCYLICHYQYQQYITKTKKNHALILVVPPAYEKPFKSIGKIIINLNPPQDLCTKTQILKFKYQTLMHTLSMPLKYHKI